MSTEEKLSRAGWLYVGRIADLEIYARKNERVLLEKSNNSVYGLYKIDSKELIQKPNEHQVEILFEKL